MTRSVFSFGRDRRVPIQTIALGIFLISGCAAAPNLAPKQEATTAGAALGDRAKSTALELQNSPKYQ